MYTMENVYSQGHTPKLATRGRVVPMVGSYISLQNSSFQEFFFFKHHKWISKRELLQSTDMVCPYLAFLKPISFPVFPFLHSSKITYLTYQILLMKVKEESGKAGLKLNI